MRKTANLRQSSKPFLLLAIVAILLMILGSLPVGSTHAQGGPEPTPTDLGGGGGGDDDDDDNGDGGAPPARPAAGISGFVYDYSGAVYVEGVAVIFETEGWQTEAVTDSNGFYQIREIDSNGGILNLRLPPGVQAAAPDWPVRLVRGSDTEVNLGYYWGDSSAIPVRLTASLDGPQLQVKIENQTSTIATGGEIRILSPPIIGVAPPVQASGAKIVDYNPHHFQIDVNEIEANEAVAKIGAEANAAVEVGQALPEIRVAFTYDQQITPQVVVLNAKSLPGLPVAALERAQSQKAAQVSETNTVILDSSEPGQKASPSNETVATTADTPAGGSKPSAEPSPTQSESMAMNNPPEKEELLPVTGRISQPIDPAALVLSIVVILGVAAGGFLALREKQSS